MKPIEILDTSVATYDQLYPRIRRLATLLAAVHIFFYVLNNVTNESESTELRLAAFITAALLTIDAKRISTQYAIFLKRLRLPCVIVSGPVFLLCGLLLELNQQTPDDHVILRRQYELVAAVAMVLLMSAEILPAIVLILGASGVVLLVGVSIFTVDLSILGEFWTTLASSYVLLFFWAIFRVVRKRQEVNHKTSALNSVGTSIAHELRTPLLSVRARASSVIKHGDQSAAFSAEAIIREVDAANTLIDMFLLNATPSSTPQTHQRFPLNQVVEEAVERFPYKSVKHQAAVDVELSDDVLLNGPRELLLHVIFNLLKNSFEHTSVTRARIVIKTSVSNSAQVSVRDNGVGIPADQLENVFTPFFSTSANYGAGVGLAFCKDTVEQHFLGTIKLVSVQNEYTEVVIGLPIEGRERSVG
ncbi:MAG: hypothetical protein GKR90_25220 [Pseudomonadales bacterium]|nr:hypothetical protein [Pseudomonadales bacterium]